MLPNKYKKSQAGNVFVLILAGVFLFGALMFTFARSGQKGSGNLTKQQTKIAAQEILNYARLVEGAVDRVRRNGCSETEISFDNAVVSGYSNPNAPLDGSCDIFSTTGGKISYEAPNEKTLDQSKSSLTNYGQKIFNGNGSVNNLRTTQAELIMLVPFLNISTCNAINQLLNISVAGSLIPEDNSGINVGDKFIGLFNTSPPASQIIGDSGSSNSISPIISGCIFESTGCSGSSCYNFFHVLLAR